MNRWLKLFVFSAVLSLGLLGTAREAPAQTEPQGRPAEAERRIAQSRFRYLMLGYGTIWVALGVYLFSLNRRIGSARGEIESLQARLEGLSRRQGR